MSEEKVKKMNEEEEKSTIVRTKPIYCYGWLAVITPITEELSDRQKLISETIQSVAHKLDMKSSPQTDVSLMLDNVIVPGLNTPLWNVLPELISNPTDQSFNLNIHNIDEEGNDIYVERYKISDVVFFTEKNYNDSDVQKIIISGIVEGEYQ